MKKKRYYFSSINDNHCYDLSYHLHNAKADGLEKITLIEAIPDNSNNEFVWCSFDGEVVDRGQCKKSECSQYHSKSGRGVCANRGNLFNHGNEVEFNVNDHE